MRSLGSRLEKLEAKQGKAPLVVIIRTFGSGEDSGLLGYEVRSREDEKTIVRRIGDESDTELIGRATASSVPTGGVIVLKEVRADS